MNPLLTTRQEPFRSSTDNLEYFHNRSVKIDNGALLFCIQGQAEIILDLKPCHIPVNTNVILLPGSIFSLASASPDFKVHYFAFSDEMFQTACFHLNPSFFHFLKENAVYTHTDNLCPIRGLIENSNAIYDDHSHQFRLAIAQNLLQIFFLDTFEKTKRHFVSQQIEGSNRRDQVFKRFINLVHANCATQRDVAFYARQLCISTRYLSSIVRQMGPDSAKSIIDNCLMLELKVALQTTSLSLKEIADRYHFPDQSFFGRYFKKHAGLSPKSYRSQFAKTEK